MSPPRVFSSKLCCYIHFDVVNAFSSPRTRKEPGFVAAAGTRTSTLIAVRSERHRSAMTTVPELKFQCTFNFDVDTGQNNGSCICIIHSMYFTACFLFGEFTHHSNMYEVQSNITNVRMK